MATSTSLRKWYLVHRWSSLVGTLLLLVMCLTGLPLVFRDEITDWLVDAPAQLAGEGPATRANLDAMVDAARGPHGLFPGQTIRWISVEDDRPEVWIALAPSYLADRKLNHVVKFNAHTGAVIAKPPPAHPRWLFAMGVVLKLHQELLLGLTGEILLAVMAVLLIVATVSGLVLYGPFMKKLPFGTVRRERGRRLAWLDLHNLLGIVTLSWVLVVVFSGLLNTMADPLYDKWRNAVLATMLKPYEGRPMPTGLASVQAATEVVLKAMPGMKIRSARFPDAELGSPHHYLVWAIGDSPLTSRLFKPALVDAKTGELAIVADVPWYLTAVQVSRPLHFGDYGGLPLKIIWAVLDLMTMVVLGSGLYLWFARRKATEVLLEKLMQEAKTAS